MFLSCKFKKTHLPLRTSGVFLFSLNLSLSLSSSPSMSNIIYLKVLLLEWIGPDLYTYIYIYIYIYIYTLIHYIHLLFSLILRWLANNSLSCFLKYCGYWTKFPLFFSLCTRNCLYVQASSFIPSVSKTHLCFRQVTPLSGQLKKKFLYNFPQSIIVSIFCL